jgi:hypothetical protein
MTILNLTQHTATPEQVAAGVVDLEGSYREFLIKTITFGEMPARDEIIDAASILAYFAEGWFHANELPIGEDTVMIGGAPWFMSALENALKDKGIKVLYAFSKRESVEEMQEDGSVKKSMVFRHLGFLEA